MEHQIKMKPSHRYLPRDKIATSIKAATLILATTAIYYQDLTIVGNEAIRSELMSHILAIHSHPSRIVCLPTVFMKERELVRV